MEKTIEEMAASFENSERKMRESASKRNKKGQKNQQKHHAIRRIFNEKET
jgi:hypothetical protein